MIKFMDVTKQYPRTTAMDHVTLELSENRIYCLLGRNGAGKTTMLKLIAGHINASSGMVMVDGKKAGTLQMPGCVNFIESRASLFNLRVIDLINIAKDLQDDFDVEFAQNILGKFRLGKEKKYKQLSLGMQTMVTTLLSLASNSKIVILDEPVLGFDAIMRKQFYTMLTESFENHPRIIIVSTHLIDEIAKTADELIIIDGGRILLQSSISDIDEKAYSLTGLTDKVKSLIKGLNVIGEKTIGGFTSASIFDRRIDASDGITIQSLGLQEFFINMVGGNENEESF